MPREESGLGSTRQCCQRAVLRSEDKEEEECFVAKIERVTARGTPLFLCVLAMPRAFRRRKSLWHMVLIYLCKYSYLLNAVRNTLMLQNNSEPSYWIHAGIYFFFRCQFDGFWLGVHKMCHVFLTCVSFHHVSTVGHCSVPWSVGPLPWWWWKDWWGQHFRGA